MKCSVDLIRDETIILRGYPKDVQDKLVSVLWHGGLNYVKATLAWPFSFSKGYLQSETLISRFDKAPLAERPVYRFPEVAKIIDMGANQFLQIDQRTGCIAQKSRMNPIVDLWVVRFDDEKAFLRSIVFLQRYIKQEQIKTHSRISHLQLHEFCKQLKQRIK